MDPEDEGEASKEPGQEIVKHVSALVENVCQFVEQSFECVLSLIIVRKTQDSQSHECHKQFVL